MDQHKPSDIFTDGSGGQFCGLDEGSIGIHLQSYKIKQLPGENLAATQPRLRSLHLLLLLSAAAAPPASPRAPISLPSSAPPPPCPPLLAPFSLSLDASLPLLLDAAAIFASPQVPRCSVLRPCSLCCRPQPDRGFLRLDHGAAALPQVKLGFDCYFSRSLPFRYKVVGERRMKTERRGKGEELLLWVGSWLCLAGFFSWSSHCCRFNDDARRIIATPSIQKLTHDNGHDWHL